MSQADVDGALVGGASIEAETFAKIVISKAKAGICGRELSDGYLLYFLFFLSCIVLVAAVLLQPG